MSKNRPLDDYTVDCADFFATVIQRQFPEVSLEDGTNGQGRPVWRIILPVHCTYSTRDVDELAFRTQRQIFMRHTRLIGYFITKAGE